MSSKRLNIVIVGDSKEAQRAVRDLAGDMDHLDGQSSRLAGGLGKIGGAAAVGFGALAGGVAVGGAALYDVGEQFDSAFDQIRVATGATGAELEGLQASFRTVFTTVPADAGDVSDAFSILNAQLGLTGSDLEGVSGQLLNLARITEGDVATTTQTAADALANWGVAAADQAGTLDVLFRTTQETGVGFDVLAGALSSNGVALRAAGLDINQASALIGGLSQAGMDASDVMPALTKSLAVAAEAGVPASQMLADTFAKIEQAPNATAAAQIAIETFGAKAGPKFAQAIQEGKLSYEGLLASIAGGSDTINGVAGETADFAESFQLFKNNLFTALEGPATAIFGVLGDALTQLTPVLTEVGALLGDTMGRVLEALLPSVMQLFEALSPILPLIADLGVMLIETLAPVFAELVAAVGPVVTMLIESLRPVLEQLKPVFGQLSVTLVDFVQNGLVPMLPSLVELMTVLTPLIPPLVQIGTELLNALLPAITLLTPLIVELIDTALSVLVPIVEKSAEGWQRMANILREVIGQPDELRTNFVAGLTVIKDKAVEVFDWFKGLPGMLWDIAKSAGRDLANGIIDGINAIIRAWNGLSFSTPDLPGTDWGGQTFGTPNLPTVPYLQAENGAFLTSPTLLLAGETAKARAGGGEIVTPAAKMDEIVRGALGDSRQAPTLSITVNGYVGSEAELGRQLTQALEQFRRSGGRNPWEN